MGACLLVAVPLCGGLHPRGPRMIGLNPPRPTGSSAKARWCQWVTDSITRALQVSPSRGMKMSQTVQGTFCEPIDDGSGGNSRVRQFLLTDWRGDYFVCRTLSVGTGDTLTIGANDVYIAKPPEIRQSAFDGLTRAVVVESWDGVLLTEATVNWS